MYMYIPEGDIHIRIRYEFEELAYLILLAIISLVVFDNYKKEVPSL